MNDIPAFYQTPTRYVAYLLLMASFSSLLNSRKIALMRLYLFQIFSILSVILVSVNYLMFNFGLLDRRQFELYQLTGLYSGSTANNEMGILSAISIMFIIVFGVKYYRFLNVWGKLSMLGGLLCSISMMAMASSRMGLVCTVLSIGFIIYRLNRNKGPKIIYVTLAFGAAMFITANLFSDKFQYMMQKNENQLTAVNINSRDEMWQSRLKEFYESPLYGVGFAYMKYGWGASDAVENKGRIESGSGWLSVMSQTGFLGVLCMIFMVIPNLLYIMLIRNNTYLNISPCR